MYRDHSVGVAVPAYNEAGFVGEVLETIPEYVDRIYAVDDCSTDDTWREIREVASRSAPPGGSATTDGGEASAAPGPSPTASGSVAPSAGDEHETVTDRETPAERDLPAESDLAADSDVAAESDAVADRDADAARDWGTDPGGVLAHTVTGAPAAAGHTDAGGRVVAIRHEENRGVGGAIKTGYLAAVEDGMDVVVVMGGDGQMDPDYLDRLLDPIVEGRADYAKGNRLLEPDHHEDMPRHREFGNGVLTLLTKIATGYWQVGDPQMGYTAITAEAIEGADLADMYEYYGYCNDLLVRLSAAGYRVADVPCPLTYADETSHISYAEYVPRVSTMLLRSFLRRLWQDRGSASGWTRLLLFVGGALATVVGVLSAVAGALSRAAGAVDSAETASQAPSTDAVVDDTPGAGATDADGADDDDPNTDSSDDAPADTVRDRSTESSADDSGRSPALTMAVGIAVLLAAMLVDGVANAARNYKERVPDDD